MKQAPKPANPSCSTCLKDTVFHATHEIGPTRIDVYLCKGCGKMQAVEKTSGLPPYLH